MFIVLAPVDGKRTYHPKKLDRGLGCLGGPYTVTLATVKYALAERSTAEHLPTTETLLRVRGEGKISNRRGIHARSLGESAVARVDDEVSNDDLIDLPLEGREFQVSSRVTSGALLRWQCMGRFEHAQHVRTASRPDGLALAVVSEAPPRMLFCI